MAAFQASISQQIGNNVKRQGNSVPPRSTSGNEILKPHVALGTQLVYSLGADIWLGYLEKSYL